MRIQSMFKDDINRKINGVVKVDQDESGVLVQELNEYVITRELRKHFNTFFDHYNEKEIIATIKANNEQSYKTAEKSGFKLIETKMYKDIYDEEEELYRFYVLTKE